MSRWLIVVFVTAAFTVAGCRRAGDEVVVYCALDREFAEPILLEFEQQTGTRVLAKYDTESTKSVGLAEQILREKSRPRCDLFWNNEILHTLRLDRAQVLAPSHPANASLFPPESQSSAGHWYGFAARVRVLLVNTDRVKLEETPRHLEDLADRQWRGVVGMAKPLFGTTATHVVALFATLGPERAKSLLLRLKANDLRILSGNKQVAVDVGLGTLAMGLTDTDDSLAEILARRPVRMVYLDSGPNDVGIVVIPNTVAMIAGAPHSERAAELLNFLLSGEVEEKLAAGPSGQIPLGGPNPSIPKELGLEPDMKRMPIDFAKAAAAWDEAIRFISDEFMAP